MAGVAGRMFVYAFSHTIDTAKSKLNRRRANAGILADLRYLLLSGIRTDGLRCPLGEIDKLFLWLQCTGGLPL